VLLIGCKSEPANDESVGIQTDTMENQVVINDHYSEEIHVDSNYLSNLTTKEKFDSSLSTLDRWIIDNEATCDVCDSSGEDYLAMKDILNAIGFMESTTGIKSNVKFNLGTIGITLMDGSSYESDKEAWQQWWKEKMQE
jgi:hypothetical protein